MLAVSPPPFDLGDTFTHPVLRAVSAVQEYATQAAKIQGNVNLSTMGKVSALRPVAEIAVAGVYRAYNAILTLGGETLAAQAKLYAVPALKPGDAAQALLDREMRDWFRNLDDVNRQRYTAQMVGGKLPAVALALIRSPVPLSASEEVIEQAWRASVAAENVGEVVDRENEQAVNDWADGLIRRVAEMLAKSAGMNVQTIAAALTAMRADDAGPFAGVGYHPTFPPTAA